VLVDVEVFVADVAVGRTVQEPVGVGGVVGVFVEDGVDIGVGVGGLVTVKNADESTPHCPALLLPCTSTRWRPLVSGLVSIVAEMTVVPPPKLPSMGTPEPSGPGTST
jgi:hypothetical protein